MQFYPDLREMAQIGTGTNGKSELDKGGYPMNEQYDHSRENIQNYTQLSDKLNSLIILSSEHLHEN